MKLYSSKNIAKDLNHTERPFVGVLTEDLEMYEPRRGSYIAIVKQENVKIPRGFKLVLITSSCNYLDTNSSEHVVIIDSSLDYLKSGDVIRFDPRSLSISVIYRLGANANSLLTTERCNSFCLMCSQPPRDIDDTYRAEDILDAIPLISQSAHEIGLTGGEPTLLGTYFIKILYSLKKHLPKTSVHVLTNGRTLQHEELAREISEVAHPDLMFGIPLYSDIAHIHDFVVQADGAFDETIRGILNLKRFSQKVEIRIVIHKQTYERLENLAEYISRNLLFVDHVALMGLEITGFTRANLDELWIDPVDYQEQLKAAVSILDSAGIRTSIYNLQLCLVPKELWPYCVKSISDWKNEYISECDLCVERNLCGGFFESSKYRRSDNIKAIQSFDIP